MTNVHPVVTVVVPAYNEEKYLGDCLSLLRKQEYAGRFEIIVADGASRDRTRAIARRFADRVVVERKRTIAAGRQAGADAARGSIVVFTDADARPPSDWLGKLVLPFSDGRVVSAYGSLALYDYRRTGIVYSSLLSAYFYWAGAFEVPAGAGSNMAVRASALRAVGGFDTDIVTGEDIELQRRLKRMGKIVYCRTAKTFVSARRVKTWGTAKFLGFHASNFVKLQMGRKGHERYEPVR